MSERKPKGLRKSAMNYSKDENNAKRHKPEVVIEDQNKDADLLEVEAGVDVTDLYQTALEKKESGDLEGHKLFLRGVVHESDRLLRTYSLEKEGLATQSGDVSSDSGPIFTWQPSPRFYWVYGNALLDLKDIEDIPEVGSQEPKELAKIAFIDEAIERFDLGIEMLRDVGGEDDWDLRTGWAKATLQKCDILFEKLPDEEESPFQKPVKMIHQVQDILKLGLDNTSSQPESIKAQRVSETVELLLNFIDVIPVPESRKDCNNFCKSLLENALKEYPEVMHLVKWYGFSCLHTGIDLAESCQASEDSDAEDMPHHDNHNEKEAIEVLSKGISYLEKSLEMAKEDKEKAEIMALLGESYMNLGNLETEEKSTVSYEKAINFLRDASELSDGQALSPEMLEAMLELEQDLLGSEE